MAFASSSFGGAFDVIPVMPPCGWTSTETDLRRTSSAADAVSAVWAAVVEPRGRTAPASIAQRRTPHPLSRHESVSLTTAIHAVLPENAPGNIASHVRPLLSPSPHQPAGAAGAGIIQCSSLGRTAVLAQERNKPGEVCWHPVPSFSTEWPIRWDPT